MQKVLTAEQMREVDRLTTERYGIPSILLMENAAHAVARVITEKLGGSVEGKSILVLCGKGNNGGDGAALARILASTGANVRCSLFGQLIDASGDARVNLEVCKSLSDTDEYANFFHEIDNPFELWSIMDDQPNCDWDCVVDALFGTGLTRPLEDPLAEVVVSLNRRLQGASGFLRSDCLTVSIDLPSGLVSNIGEIIGAPFDADVTVSLTAPKPANVISPSSSWNGDLVVVNIGSPQKLIGEQPSQLYLSEQSDVAKWLIETEFCPGSYKNKRGHALMVAGSASYSGAAVLCGNAAMRSGVGLVTIATPRSSKDSIASRVLPEVMVKGVAETTSASIDEAAFEELNDLLGKADSVAIGSGISQDESTKKFVQKVIEFRRQPVVIDADALNLLSPFSESWLPANAGGSDIILTPHEGEFMRLLGTADKDAIKDRVAAVRDFSQKHNVILVLKGERVLIGEPGGKVVVNPTGNSGLGKAGNGDTLTGILAGFVAQATAMNIDIFATVVAAVYVAGLAGDIAEKKYGKRVMTASDVRECLTDAFEQIGS